MAPRNRIRLEEQRDFGGGLNLSDEIVNLGDTETFDLQNVDIDRRGGFSLRRGTRKFIDLPTQRTVTATGASRTANVVTATGLSPLNGDPGGLKPGQQISVVFADTSYNGTFTVSTAAGGGSTATWSQTAADDASAGAGTITEGFTGTSGTPDSGYSFVDSTGVRHLLAARAGWVRRWDGSAWQDVLIHSGSGVTHFAEFNNLLYIQRPGQFIAHTWNGSGTSTALTTVVGNYNDDLAAPNQGNFPVARVIAVHAECMWAAGVVDSGGTFNCRVRWSHPGQPQDWRTNDFIDIDPDDENGIIRALVPFGERLIVFKDHAVYAISGYPPGGFSVTNLTKQIGCSTVAGVVATEGAIYFWDTETGAWSYDGKEFKHIFQPLFSLIDEGKLNTAFSFQTIVIFYRERLYVSSPFLAAPYANTFLTLVYDPNAGKNGGWTLHTTSPFGWWTHKASVSGGDTRLLWGGSGHVMEMDVEGFYFDRATNGVDVPIVAWYTTRWFDARARATRKRWKRPIFILQSGAQQRMLVEVMRDYDPAKIVKSFTIDTVLDPAEGIWDTDDWDDFQWAQETLLAGDGSVLLRGTPLGNGTAIAMRMKNVTSGKDWRVNGLTVKWIDKRLRN